MSQRTFNTFFSTNQVINQTTASFPQGPLPKEGEPEEDTFDHFIRNDQYPVR